MTTNNPASLAKPTRIIGRLIDVSDGGESARVYDAFYVRALEIPVELRNDALRLEGYLVNISGEWVGDILHVGDIAAVDSHRSEEILRNPPVFDVEEDGRIKWNIWPEDEDPEEFDRALREWRRA